MFSAAAPSSMEKAVRKSTREKVQITYSGGGTGVDEFHWTKMLKTKTSIFKPYSNSMPGHMVTVELLQHQGFSHPIVVEEEEGLDMNIPKVTVSRVAELVGEERIVDVLEVSTQTDRQMKLRDWAAYFNTPRLERERILNVISLEIGESTLGKMTKRPKLVRDLDWIDIVWPRSVSITEYPRVQLYCLMGVQDCYTDFHIDFGGTSVFYHIISGQKIFYLIEPTERNLKIYAKWSTSPDQSSIFLGDLVPVCYELRLYAGNTMFIPSGWIHAVFTPEDTVVIGGNFLHAFAIESQLAMAQMEKDTNVPMRFRFPYFANMQWYAAKKYLYDLRDISVNISQRELISLQALVDHLSKLAVCSTNYQLMTGEERKSIRSEVPIGIKNLRELLTTLRKALDFRRRGARVEIEEDDWDSEVSEMEFLDEQHDLLQYLPEDVDKFTDEEDFGETPDLGGMPTGPSHSHDDEEAGGEDDSSESSESDGKEGIQEDDDDELDSDELAERIRKRKAIQKIKMLKKRRKGKGLPTAVGGVVGKKKRAPSLISNNPLNKSIVNGVPTRTQPTFNASLSVRPEGHVPPLVPPLNRSLMVVPKSLVVPVSKPEGGKPIKKKPSVFDRLKKSMMKKR